MLINHGGEQIPVLLQECTGNKSAVTPEHPESGGAAEQPSSHLTSSVPQNSRFGAFHPSQEFRKLAVAHIHNYLAPTGKFSVQSWQGKSDNYGMGRDACAGEQHLHWRKHPVIREMFFFLCSSCGAVINLEPPSAGGDGSPAPAVHGAHGVWGCARRVLCGAGPGTQPCSSFAAMAAPWPWHSAGALQNAL